MLKDQTQRKTRTLLFPDILTALRVRIKLGQSNVSMIPLSNETYEIEFSKGCA